MELSMANCFRYGMCLWSDNIINLPNNSLNKHHEYNNFKA